MNEAETYIENDQRELPRLLPWETLHHVEEVPQFFPLHPPSPHHELMRLAQAKAEGEVGRFGPSLAALALERPDKEAPQELRKYEALFGRDSLRVALDVLPVYPLLLHATIRSLAELQGRVFDDGREEEPGRIIHEYRTPDDPVAQKLTKENGWQWPYYGSVDATPQFMHAVYAYAHTVDGGEHVFKETVIDQLGNEVTIAETYRRALSWLETRLSANAEGLLEYQSTLPKGIENQVWRDSWDGYHHKDGSLANRDHGIASVEVQQLTYDTLLEAAKVFETLFLDREKAESLRAQAEKMRTTIIDTFWVPEGGGFFALGTDRGPHGDLRKLDVKTSNMGHLLRSPLLKSEKYRPYREAVIMQLFSPEMLNVSGIRTLASDEVRFRPGAYHNGSVWLWDTYYIAEGLRYHGYYGLANVLTDRIHSVINVTQKFPEYVRGDTGKRPTLNTRVVEVMDNSAKRINRIEQPPQEVQAWTVAADIAREYYSGRVPKHAYDYHAVQLENAILSTLET